MKDLVERLRKADDRARIWSAQESPCAIYGEAADTIEFLQRQVDMLHGRKFSERDYTAFVSQLAEANKKLEVARATLDRSRIAIDDWLNIYAEDHCDEQRVLEAKRRVNEYGTIGYIAHVQQQNREALSLLSDNAEVEP